MYYAPVQWAGCSVVDGVTAGHTARRLREFSVHHESPDHESPAAPAVVFVSAGVGALEDEPAAHVPQVRSRDRREFAVLGFAQGDFAVPAEPAPSSAQSKP